MSIFDLKIHYIDFFYLISDSFNQFSIIYLLRLLIKSPDFPCFPGI